MSEHVRKEGDAIWSLSISPKDVVPLSEQLSNEIKQRILSGEWPLGMMLPSELELKQVLGISRSTIRVALRDVEKDGLIVTAPGKGRFVRSPAPQKGKTRFIGYITENLQQNFHYEMLKGAESIAQEAGYRLLFFHTDNNPATEADQIEQVIAEDVDGILLYSIRQRIDDPAKLVHPDGRPIPVVSMDRKVHNLHCDFVGCDNYDGAYQAVRHLIENGHRNIVFLSRPILELMPVAERYRGYQQAMRDAGLEPGEPWMVGEEHAEVSSRHLTDLDGTPDVSDIRQIQTLFRERGMPSAVFAMHDGMAFLCYKALKDTSVRIPDDLSIVGFNNNSELCSFLDLTTVNQDTFAIGRKAMEFLLERIAGSTSVPRDHLTSTRLVIRSSVAVRAPGA